MNAEIFSEHFIISWESLFQVIHVLISSDMPLISQPISCLSVHMLIDKLFTSLELQLSCDISVGIYAQNFNFTNYNLNETLPTKFPFYQLVSNVFSTKVLSLTLIFLVTNSSCVTFICWNNVYKATFSSAPEIYTTGNYYLCTYEIHIKILFFYNIQVKLAQTIYVFFFFFFFLSPLCKFSGIVLFKTLQRKKIGINTFKNFDWNCLVCVQFLITSVPIKSSNLC